jgi:hypothetical protein
MGIDDDLWFPESAMDYPLEKIPSSTSLSADDGFGDFLSSVDSVDEHDFPQLVISAEGLNGILNLLSGEGIQLTPKPSYVGRPKTPPTTTPTFNELPPIISPSDIYLDSDCESLAPVDEAFQPPPAKKQAPAETNVTDPPHVNSIAKKKGRRKDLPRAVNPFDARHIDRLIECMQKSHASRREILRCRLFFGNHPALEEMERLDDCQRRIWAFMVKGRKYHSQSNLS